MDTKTDVSNGRGHGPASFVSTSTSSDKSWWQWTHGKSGSVSSSSDGVNTTLSTAHGYFPCATAESASSHSPHAEMNASSASVPAWGFRWEKRATRTGLMAREELGRTSTAPMSSKAASSPKVVTSSLSPSFTSTAAASGNLSKKKFVQPCIRSTRDISVKKRFSPPAAPGLHEFSLAGTTKGTVSGLGDAHTEIRWTGGPGKRKVVKKDKKSTRGSSLHGSSRSTHPSQRPMRAWLDSVHQHSHDGGVEFPADVHMLEEKPTRCSSPISTASTISSAASITSTSLALADPVATCARAILVDCYRERRHVESGGLRKRTLEGRSKAGKGSDSRIVTYPRDFSKSPDGCGISCGSSSSDDELKEVSRRSDYKIERDSDRKLTPEEERYRQLMLCAYDASSSPEIESISPLLEEKGLSAEMRYQLPLARGTANETDKECSICKTRYGIGDHICTLPCQHFFHYRCVDQWLCSHISCPLCRWDVTADADSAGFNQKHQLTACSPSDREAFQRKMRSSTHRAGFRPVEPEVDQLQQHLATLNLEEDCSELSEEQVQYLVCPTPQRPQRK